MGRDQDEVPAGTPPRQPLLAALSPILRKVEAVTVQAREFYSQVLLSQHPCPACGGQLAMSDISQATCSQCGQVLDPTLNFQRSSCCVAALVRRQLHYACTTPAHGAGRLFLPAFCLMSVSLTPNTFAR